VRVTGWRIVKAHRSAAPLDGEGARRFPGRWNSRGVAVVYTADSPALAALEVLVHLDSPDLLRKAYVLVAVEFDETLVRRVLVEDLPPGWNAPVAPPELRAIGDRWVAEGDPLVLAVPSAVAPRHTNYVINPLHPDISRVRLHPPEHFTFDPRLK
jgi:RES domain-containing protein